MQRLKKWLEGSAIALILAGTLTLGIPTQAQAHGLTLHSSWYSIWENQGALSRMMGPWSTFEDRDCTGPTRGRGATALTAYMQGGPGTTSYSNQSGCHNKGSFRASGLHPAMSFNDLRSKARDDWDDCRAWASEMHDYINSNQVGPPTFRAALIKEGVNGVRFAAGVVTGFSITRWLAERRLRRQSQDNVCGAWGP